MDGDFDMDTNDIETETVPSILLPCTSCNRTFRPEALAKHAKVCEKILMKKRKQFDSSKQRLQGTEIENFSLQPAPKQTRKKESQLNLSKSKWKEKVEQVRTMQAMKKQVESPLSAQVKPSDHEECPYCGRSFGPKAYERHTEFCKEQHHKLKLTNSGNTEALERLKVRTMYRGPLTNKVLNRDRYQPNRNRDPSPLGTSYSESLDDVNKSRGLMRNGSLRSSLRSKSETTPPPPLRRTMTQINPPTRAPRGSTKDLNETDLLQKTPTLNNKPRLISKESNEKRVKPTNSKKVAHPSATATSPLRKSPLKLNNIDVNIFKELSVVSCFTPESSVAENQYFRPISTYQPTVTPQEMLKPKPLVNIVSKTQNENIIVLQPIDNKNKSIYQPITQENLKPKPMVNIAPKTQNKEMISPQSAASKDEDSLQPSFASETNALPTPTVENNSSSLKVNINNQNEVKKCGTKNQAFTIEFEPDNRFLVYEHYKAGLKKSPVIFKKRISEGFETVKKICDEQGNSEKIDVITDSEDRHEHYNLASVHKEESVALGETDKMGWKKEKAQNTDENPTFCNEYSLSWRERVLEIMEEKDVSCHIENKSNPEKDVKKNIAKNYSDNQMLATGNISIGTSVSESQIDESNFKSPIKCQTYQIKPESADKCTDINHDLLIDEELSSIFCEQKVQEIFTGTSSNNDTVIDELQHEEIRTNGDIKENDFSNKPVNINTSSLLSINSNNLLEGFNHTEIKPFSEKDVNEPLQSPEFCYAETYFAEENKITKAILEEETSCIKNVMDNKCEKKQIENESYFQYLEEQQIKMSDIIGVSNSEHNAVDFPYSPVTNEDNGIMDDNKEFITVKKEKFDENKTESKELVSDISLKNEYQQLEIHNLEQAQNDNLSDRSNGTNDEFNTFEEMIEVSGDQNSSQQFHQHTKTQGSGEMISVNDNLSFASVLSTGEPMPHSNSELQCNQLNKHDNLTGTESMIFSSNMDKEEELYMRKENDYFIENSSSSLKDQILKIAGQEFVLMSNRKNKSCSPNNAEESKVEDSSNQDFYKDTTDPGIVLGNATYCGAYKDYTYCKNTHTNVSQDNDKSYSEILPCPKNNGESEIKMTTWEELSHQSNLSVDCDMLSDPDSLEQELEDEDDFYFFQPYACFESRVPYKPETLHSQYKNVFFSLNGDRCNFSSRSYRSEKNKGSVNETSVSSQDSFCSELPPSFSSAGAGFYKRPSYSKHVDFDSTERAEFNSNFKHCTLPPLNKNNHGKITTENKTKSMNYGTLRNGGCHSKFQCFQDFKNDHYSIFSNMKDSDEEYFSDSDWDLSDPETVEETKSPVYTHSSKKIYNKYYEEVKYTQESNEFHTIKTSVYQLPYTNSDYFKEKEIKLPNIKSKQIHRSTSFKSRFPTNTNVENLKRRCDKLPLLRTFEDRQWYFPHVVRHVITTVLPERFSIEDAEKYNPYLSAERQMLELFGADDGKGKTTLPDIHHSSPLQSSPVSAFVKYSSPKRASSIESLKSDNKENNNVNPEINDFPPIDEKMDNRKHFSLSNLSLCSVVSIDSIDCNKNTFNTKLVNSHVDDFQRSFSAIESKSNRAYVKPKVNLQQMLYGLPSPEQTEQATSSESSNSDTGNLEACEAELLISMLEFEKMLKSSPPSSPETSPNLCSSSEQKRKETKDDAEENRNQKHLNNSIDSAYSSLTRSSGADGETGNLEMSKFCHECGAKYPIAGAKFCCNCGMRRITL